MRPAARSLASLLALASLPGGRADWSAGASTRKPVAGYAGERESMASLFKSKDSAPYKRARLDFYSNGRDGVLYANGVQFSIKGLNWFGAETAMRVPDGLWKRSLGDLLDFMATNGFNSLRLFISMQNVAENKRTPSNFDEYGTPQLVGTDFLGMLEEIAKEAALHGILVVLANHQIRNGYPDEWPGSWDGNWFDEMYQPELIVELWTRLALSLCKEHLWNVIGVDLLNEPYALRWPSWVRAAERVGNHIQSQCPQWLIFVEGTGNEEPAEAGMEWGENLIGVLTRPIQLTNNSKLVYSPHVYGPSLFEANDLPEPEYMEETAFPRSCREVWQRHFGFVRQQTGRPVVIGETGGRYVSKRDIQWQEELIDWAAQTGTGLFYYALNPNLRGVGGVLLEDWSTAHDEKLQMLSRLPATLLDSILKWREHAPHSPPSPASPAVDINCPWSYRGNVAPLFCYSLTDEEKCEQSFTTATVATKGHAVVCTWIAERLLCEGSEAPACPPPSPPHPFPPPPQPPPHPLEPSPPPPHLPVPSPAPPTPHAVLARTLRSPPPSPFPPRLPSPSYSPVREGQYAGVSTLGAAALVALVASISFAWRAVREKLSKDPASCSPLTFPRMCRDGWATVWRESSAFSRLSTEEQPLRVEERDALHVEAGRFSTFEPICDDAASDAAEREMGSRESLSQAEAGPEEEEAECDTRLLTVHVMVRPTDLAQEDEDAIHLSTLAGTLSLDREEIGSILELRAAVRLALAEAPDISQAISTSAIEPSLWYGNADGSNTNLIIGSSNLSAILAAERIWFAAPSRSARAPTLQRPYELAQGRMSMRSKERHQSLFGNDLDDTRNLRANENHAFLD
ncbi:hypothetical protein AB1Y20_005501 [Prymnesium parvum]|uniref:Glycoside hydrolase family 5 domain-containing protein n=1 Tax=Prymnesium parvum TaxID=97485 RepID=A0AB34J4G9_PRYPA